MASLPSYRRDPDNISMISAAPSYHSTFNDTQLIAPNYRSYNTSEPRPRAARAQTNNHIAVHRIPGFQSFSVTRDESALHKIAARRRSAAMEDTLKQFSINYERQELLRGSASSHPMLITTSRSRPRSKSAAVMPFLVEEAVDDRCPLVQDNEVWDYGFMCQGSYPSLAIYQAHQRELTKYEEKEAAIKSAHRRLCGGRSYSDASQTSTVSSVSEAE